MIKYKTFINDFISSSLTLNILFSIILSQNLVTVKTIINQYYKLYDLYEILHCIWIIDLLVDNNYAPVVSKEIKLAKENNIIKP